MVQFDFEKILKLSAMNKDFFELSNGLPAWKKTLKIVFLLLLTPVYLCTELLACVLYFLKTLLTIPSKLVHGIRTANTPYDENNRTTYTVSYILLYLWIVPFDAFAIFTSWMIALLSLFLDCLGNIVNLGGRHLASFELCFSTDSDEDPQSHKHFWLMVLGVAVMIFIIVVGDKLATSFATSYQKINNGIETFKALKFNQHVYDFFHYAFLVVGYLFSTILITLFYNKNRKGEKS